MAFGIKQRKIVTKNKYTKEELFEAIKDHEFTPGKPDMVKHAFTDIIVFPQVDRLNQVQIIPGWMSGGAGNKWTIMKAEAAGADNVATNIAVEFLTDGWGNLGSLGGKASKLCEKQVDEVADELVKMGL